MMVTNEYIARVDVVLGLIRAELLRARSKHGPMRSSHEGYAVILEEVDELWDDIKKNNPHGASIEAIQVGAMALSYVVDLGQIADPMCTRDGACGIDHGVCNGLPRRDP